MNRLIPLTMATALVAWAQLASGAEAAPSPYAGQEQRAVKSLSERDVEDLLAGRGWGLAKAAELNGYPGPAHLLELAGPLGLDAEQRRAVEDVFTRMRASAVAIGARFVEAERALDAAFAAGAATPELIAELTAEAASLRGQLRATHLAAHVEARPLLTAEQVARYQHLRGYASDDAHARHRGHAAGHR